MQKNDLLHILDGDRENRRWRYICPETHRQFHIEEMDDGRFFLFEFRPNGRLCDGEGPEMRCWDDDRLKAILERASPNTYWVEAEKAGIDLNKAVFIGTGHGVYTRYFNKLDDCIAAIQEAIGNNEWFSSEDEEKRNDPVFQAELRKREEAMKREYWESKRAAIEQAERVNHGLFKGCCNLFGPLPKESQAQILAYLNSPSQEKWESIHCMLITPGKTLWQAWLKIDRMAPISKPLDGEWPNIPEPETLRQAIRHAVEQEKQS